jgi:hypothetical protein
MHATGSTRAAILLLALGTALPVLSQRGGPPPPIWLPPPPGNAQPGNAQQRAHPQAPRQVQTRRGRRRVWQDHRAQNRQAEHRDWRERGGYQGYRIPEARFRSQFGPRHLYRVYRYPVAVVGGFIHFQLGGFGFSILDPVPQYWSENWYDSDDVYIDDSGDGYYMHNRRHPQDRIAISVSIH